MIAGLLVVIAELYYAMYIFLSAQDICGLVSKTAFPVSHKGGLGVLHMTSLEALLAILAALAERLYDQPKQVMGIQEHLMGEAPA